MSWLTGAEWGVTANEATWVSLPKTATGEAECFKMHELVATERDSS